MKKRLLKFIGIGLGVDVALFSLLVLLLYWGLDEFPKLQDLYKYGFIWIFIATIIGTIGIAALAASQPYFVKKLKGQSTTKSEGVCARLGALTSGIFVVCLAFFLIPTMVESGSFSLPSIGLFSKEKAEAKIVTDPIKIGIDPLNSNAYLAKCTIRNTGDADAANVLIVLYYYDPSGVKQLGSSDHVDHLAAGKSYSFTLRISAYGDMFYPYGVNDPYLDISYLTDS